MMQGNLLNDELKARSYRKISAVQICKVKSYFSGTDKLQLLQRHNISDTVYMVVQLKLIFKKTYAQIARELGFSTEWARQIFLRAINELSSYWLLW